MDSSSFSRFDPRSPSKASRAPSASRPGSKEEERTNVSAFLSPVANSQFIRRSSRVYTEASRRKSIKVPRDGTFLEIKSVFDIYKQVRVLVGMVSNVWGWSQSTTTQYRQVLPGLVRVHVGNKMYSVPGYLLQELETISVVASSSTGPTLSGVSVTDPSVQDVRIRHPTEYFRYVLLLLKLRWLLRLHSACCELDYKVCSLRNLILGIQYVVLQQHEEVQCDSIFDTKVSRHIGSHLNLESVFDDIVDQLQRALGGAWRGFLEYVQSCDPDRAMQNSKMDSRISAPSIASNDHLAVVIDTIFVASFLRQNRKEGQSKLKELYSELEQVGLPQPEVPPLRAATHLRAWAKNRSKAALHDRSKEGKKDAEKLAQLDAVLLTAAVELHLAEVEASEDEIAEFTANAGVSAAFPDQAPNATSIDHAGKADSSAGPPAARVILEDKPQLSPALFEAAVICIHHHDTFPDGIRERLYGVLNEEYGLTREQIQTLAIGATQNIDGKRLPESTLLAMEHREKLRLRQHQVNTSMDTSHLLVPALVQAPIQKNQRAKYALSPAPLPRPPCFASSIGDAMSKSMPGLHSPSGGFSGSHRDPFKVPLGTGPLTMDHDLKKLRTTGFFMKMPALGN